MNDVVNHPAHYTAYEGVEVIDITERFNFNLGNAIKYIARAGLKDPEKEVEDLKKAVWYVNREMSRSENNPDYYLMHGLYNIDVRVLTDQMNHTLRADSIVAISQFARGDAGALYRASINLHMEIETAIKKVFTKAYKEGIDKLTAYPIEEDPNAWR